MFHDIIWTWFECPWNFSVLKFHPHCQVGIQTMNFVVRAFNNWLGWISCAWILVDLQEEEERSEETNTYSTFFFLTKWYALLPLDSCQQNVMNRLMFYTMSLQKLKTKLISFLYRRLKILCYKNKMTKIVSFYLWQWLPEHLTILYWLVWP